MVEIDQHLLVLDLDRVDVDGFRGGQAEGAAASQVEMGAVEVALYRAVLDVPVAQGNVPVIGLAERIKHKPNQLSDGEKQRVAIARAMINKPKLILADEPTGNLDEDTGELIFSLFRKINKEHNQSIVVVTHARDLSQVTDRQIYLKRGVLE